MIFYKLLLKIYLLDSSLKGYDPAIHQKNSKGWMYQSKSQGKYFPAFSEHKYNIIVLSLNPLMEIGKIIVLCPLQCRTTIFPLRETSLVEFGLF